MVLHGECSRMKKKNFINYCGLLGVVAFISYTVAVIFSPLAYPGYNWMAQEVESIYLRSWSGYLQLALGCFH